MEREAARLESADTDNAKAGRFLILLEKERGEPTFPTLSLLELSIDS
jgi:hypothetical protein